MSAAAFNCPCLCHSGMGAHIGPCACRRSLGKRLELTPAVSAPITPIAAETIVELLAEVSRLRAEGEALTSRLALAEAVCAQLEASNAIPLHEVDSLTRLLDAERNEAVVLHAWRASRESTRCAKSPEHKGECFEVGNGASGVSDAEFVEMLREAGPQEDWAGPSTGGE